MMYSLSIRRSDLLVVRTRDRVLRSDKCIQFTEDMSACEIYSKSPYIRGNYLWKQLDSIVQHAKTKTEFARMLTDEIIENLKL